MLEIDFTPRVDSLEDVGRVEDTCGSRVASRKASQQT